MIPVNKPLFLGNEKKYLLNCIKTGWISSDGPYVKKFEERFAKLEQVINTVNHRDSKEESSCRCAKKRGCLSSFKRED